MENSQHLQTEAARLVDAATTFRKAWSAVLHYNGNGAKFYDSHCFVRIFANPISAVVLCTELKQNQEPR